MSPFFSPDGSWVGFFASGALRKVATAGGIPMAVCELSNFDRPSGSWGRDGHIVFSRGINTSSGLLRVSEEGGSAETLTVPRGDRGERWHGLPQPLPGGEVLFTVATADGSRAAILSRESGEWEILNSLGPAVAARYLDSGHLVFGQPGRLMSVAWSLGEGVRDAPVPVLEDVYTSRRGLPYFSTSQSGSLLYVQGSVVRTVPMLVDRAGNGAPIADDPGAFQHPRISPDGRHVAVDVTWRGRSDIYVYDLERGRRRRLTREGFNIDPLWTPDGKRIVFRSRRSESGAQAIYWTPADGSGSAEVLLADADMVPGSWAPGGVMPLTSIPAASNRRDLWILDLGSGDPPEPVLTASYNEGWGAVSPDGQWLAYVSDESGEDEIWVRPFRAAGVAEQISVDGGIEPVWSPDGAELFYRQGDRFLAVDIETEPRIRSGAPRELFRGRYDLSPTGHQHYDVAPDGQHFAVQPHDPSQPLGEVAGLW
ncbi:MAG: PD40 domain-containing protein [Planctomycetes bacterium]|nr:PD40 domain-containing protein [Planctomycetota bacterium]